LRKAWHEIQEKVGRQAVNTKGKLADARPLSVVGQTVTIGFDPEFEDEATLFGSGRERLALEHGISGCLGRAVKAHVVVGDAGFEDALTEECASEAASDSTAEPRRKDWTKDEAVKRALDVLDGSIIDVRD